MNTERIWGINSYIQMQGEVHINDLIKLYPNVSAITIRRDLAYLEEQGHIVRTRGGAKSIRRLTQIKEDAYALREMENAEKKSAVAQKALKFFGGAGSYYMDSGTTMMQLARAIPEESCFVVTNSPSIALELTRIKEASVVVLGGSLNREYHSISGPSAIEQVKGLNINVAFMATSGFSAVNGFTNGVFGEAELKRAVIARARKTVLLMDSSKYDRALPYTFAQLGDIDYLVCDTRLPDEIVSLAGAKGTIII